MTEYDRRQRGQAPSKSSMDRGSRAGAGSTTASLPPRPSNELPHAAIQLDESRSAAHEFERDPFGLAPIQMVGKENDESSADSVHATAAHGVAGAGSELPFLATIQASFGRHDVSGVAAHVGGDAAKASTAIGAEAYAAGNHVAFKSAPDLHTTAHEAAHVVQQRSGVHLKGGVGHAGDAYEQNADAVADRVVRGESAEDLLASVTAGGVSSSAVQRKKVEHRDDEPVTHGQIKDMAERQELVAWQNDSMELWFHRMVDGVIATCRSLAGPKQKKSDTLSRMIDLAAMAAIAGGAGVISAALARHVARGLSGVAKEVGERFSQDSLKELMKKSLTVGAAIRHDMTSDDIVANFQLAQVNKIRHAQSDFLRSVGEGFGRDTWANLPIAHLRTIAIDLSEAVKSDEVPHLASKNTAVEWANLIARMNHGAGGWDPWAGEHGSEKARPTAHTAYRPERIFSPVDDPSNSNVDQDSASMRDLVDDDQRKMNPSTSGILEIDIWGRKEFSLYKRFGSGIRLNGVAAHVKALVADHPSLGDIKMNKLVTIYWDETINPPVPDSRFLITADGYVRSWTTWTKEQLDAAAKFVQSLPPTVID